VASGVVVGGLVRCLLTATVLGVLSVRGGDGQVEGLLVVPG